MGLRGGDQQGRRVGPRPPPLGGARQPVGERRRGQLVGPTYISTVRHGNEATFCAPATVEDVA
eukprot:7822303-Lingulodinium_polyedra.AAC.1